MVAVVAVVVDNCWEGEEEEERREMMVNEIRVRVARVRTESLREQVGKGDLFPAMFGSGRRA